MPASPGSRTRSTRPAVQAVQRRRRHETTGKEGSGATTSANGCDCVDGFDISTDTPTLPYNVGATPVTGEHQIRSVTRRHDSPRSVGPLLSAAVGTFFTAEEKGLTLGVVG